MSRDRIVGQNIATFLPPDMVGPLLKVIARAIASGSTVRYEYCLDIEGVTQHFSAKIVRISDSQVLSIARNVTNIQRVQNELESYRNQLEELVDVRTKALNIAMENLKSLQKSTIDAHLEVIHRLASAAEFKDKETGNHIIRMAEYAGLLGRLCGFSEEKIDLLRQASPLHDIGKIGIPDSILTKPGRLDEKEWEEMKRHTIYGAEILSASSSDHLNAGHLIALTHHERWDGSGYPQGLSGERIPLMGRICAVSDVFDALTSERPYKRAYSNTEALEIMQAGRGSHFDPNLIDLFIAHFDDFKAIQLLCSGEGQGMTDKHPENVKEKE
ncbi:HD-GYP domain-containing protein [Desulfoplanes sp.]